MTPVLYYEVPIGDLKITATEEGINSIHPTKITICYGNQRILCYGLPCDSWIVIFRQKPEANLLPLVLEGTYFQKRVWLRLL